MIRNITRCGLDDSKPRRTLLLTAAVGDSLKPVNECIVSLCVHGLRDRLTLSRTMNLGDGLHRLGGHVEVGGVQFPGVAHLTY